MDDTHAARLASGALPKTPDDLFARLQELGIETNTIHHAPVFTVAESKAQRMSASYAS